MRCAASRRERIRHRAVGDAGRRAVAAGRGLVGAQTQHRLGGARGKCPRWLPVGPHRRRRIRGRRAQRRDHIGLELARGERPVVDAHFIDPAGEELAPDAVAADPQRAGRRQQRAADGAAADLHPVDVQAQGRVVVGRREMRPGVERQLTRARARPSGTPGWLASHHIHHRRVAGRCSRRGCRSLRWPAP